MTELLVAGKDLDVQVAKILGLNIVCMDWPCYRNPETGTMVSCVSRMTEQAVPYPVYKSEYGTWPPEKIEGWADELVVDVEPVPEYSTDIVSAMVAMEWVWQHSPWSSIYRVVEGYAIDTDLPVWVEDNTVSAESLSLAICKAVLRIDKYEREQDEDNQV